MENIYTHKQSQKKTVRFYKYRFRGMLERRSTPLSDPNTSPDCSCSRRSGCDSASYQATAYMGQGLGTDGCVKENIAITAVRLF